MVEVHRFIYLFIFRVIVQVEIQIPVSSLLIFDLICKYRGRKSALESEGVCRLAEAETCFQIRQKHCKSNTSCLHHYSNEPEEYTACAAKNEFKFKPESLPFISSRIAVL